MGQVIVTPFIGFMERWKCGSLSPFTTADDITRILGVAPNTRGSSDGKVTIEWLFTVNGQTCAIWDYRGVQWSTFGQDEHLAALFSDYQAGTIRQSQWESVA